MGPFRVTTVRPLTLAVAMTKQSAGTPEPYIDGTRAASSATEDVIEASRAPAPRRARRNQEAASSPARSGRRAGSRFRTASAASHAVMGETKRLFDCCASAMASTARSSSGTSAANQINAFVSRRRPDTQDQEALTVELLRAFRMTWAAIGWQRSSPLRISNSPLSAP